VKPNVVGVPERLEELFKALAEPRRVAILRLVRRDGAKRLYRASDEGIDELRAYLDAFWDDSLLSLKQQIARNKVRCGGG
jgi:hypothetical protein